MADELTWRGSGERRTVLDGTMQPIAEVYRAHTDDGPRWFARGLPSRGQIAGPCDTFGEAAEALVAAIDRGDLR